MRDHAAARTRPDTTSTVGIALRSAADRHIACTDGAPRGGQAPVLAALQIGTTLGGALIALLWGLAAWRAGHPGWGCAGVLVMLASYALVLGLQFVLLRRVTAAEGAPSASIKELVGAWWGEVRAAPVVFCWRQPFRSRRWPDYLPKHAPGQRGVLLVHGFVCNRGVWTNWTKRLTTLGVPFVAVSLEPIFGSIDDYLPALESAVQRLESCTGQPPVIVAHSMGGLAARRWWAGAQAQGPVTSRVHRLITIGTPHRGTWLARFAFSRNGREMRPGSPWLQALGQLEGQSHVERTTCFYGNCDNIVFPTSGATQPGADNRQLRGVAHVHMADSPEPWTEAMRYLRDSD